MITSFTILSNRRKAQKQARDQSVQHLLEVSPSSIYLKFVWRHLVNWRQGLLDPYINAQNAFRGPFYEPPTERKFREPKEAAAAKPKGRKARTDAAPAIKLGSFSTAIKHTRNDVKTYIKTVSDRLVTHF